MDIDRVKPLQPAQGVRRVRERLEDKQRPPKPPARKPRPGEDPDAEPRQIDDYV